VSRSQLVLAAAAALALVAVVLILHGRGRPGSAVLASWSLTPGVLNPDVTQQTIGTTICVRGYTRSIRPPSEYTSGLKVRQMRVYRLRGSPSHFQEDHLISLELGGHPTDPRNLWPEPYPRAADVDQIENELNRRVCTRSMTLHDAQLEESRIKHTKG
jgi:hypothetical protein